MPDWLLEHLERPYAAVREWWCFLRHRNRHLVEYNGVDDRVFVCWRCDLVWVGEGT